MTKSNEDTDFDADEIYAGAVEHDNASSATDNTSTYSFFMHVATPFSSLINQTLF